jgi:magnesium transporter
MKYILLCTPEGKLTETEDIELLKQALATGSHRIWMDLEDPSDEEVGMLGALFNFHDLAVEQVIHDVQVPKLLVYDHYAFLVLHRIFYNFETEECERREFEVFFSDRFIVTTHSNQLSRTFAAARQMVRESPKDLLGKGTAFVLIRLLSLAVRDYLPVIEQWQDNLDDIEHSVLKGQHDKILDQILQFKKLVSTMRKSLLPERDVIAQFHEKTNGSFLSAEARRRFHTLMGEWQALLRELDSLKEHAGSVFEVYAAMLTIEMTEANNKLSFIMQRLTIAATIFMPLTFIVGIYGMNFDYMPEFHWKGFYYVLWGFMISLVAGMLIFFKKRKWL